MLVGCNKTNRQNKHLKNISTYGMIENLQICMIIYQIMPKNRFLKKFTEKYQKIYEGIGAKNLKVKMKGENTKDKELFLLKLKWIRM